MIMAMMEVVMKKIIRTPCCYPVVLSLALFTVLVAVPVTLGQETNETTYEKAQEEMARGEYENAAELFRQYVELDHEAEYAADALYWESFARYRLGTIDQLRAARDALEQLYQRYPDYAASGDAAELATRISGELARRGDPKAAQLVARKARELEERTTRMEREAEREEAQIARENARIDRESDRIARETSEIEREAERIAREDAEIEWEEASESLEHPPHVSRVPDVTAVPIPLPPWGMSDDDDARVTALHALYRMDPDRALPILRKILKQRDAETAHLRQQALLILGSEVTEEDEEIVLDVLRNDPDPGVRRMAVVWFSQYPSEKSFAALEELLREEEGETPRLREQVVTALFHHPDPRAGELLKEIAASEDMPQSMRQVAIAGLVERDIPGVQDFLIVLYNDLDDVVLKESVLFAVARDGGEGSGSWLRGIALDDGESADLRKVALYLAEDAGAIDSAELSRLYDESTDHVFREQILSVLAHRLDPAATEKLMEIARSDTDPDLQRYAIFWLGQSDDPRAAKVLEEIIDQ